ncbi:zinc finger domain-containing protein [Streptomyces nigra]
MQKPEHQKSKCPKCGAGRGEPCTRRDGRVAAKVHYGRPYWSSRVGKSRATDTREDPAKRLAALAKMGLI